MATKKDQIYKAALKAFSQNEFSEARMDDIAEMASVAKGTLYYHFKTKEELFLYVMEKGMDKFLKKIDDVTQSNLSRDHMLYGLLKVHLEFFAEEKEFCQLLVNKAWGSQNLHPQVQKITTRYFEKVEAFFGLLQKEGFINSTVDIPTLASSLFGMILFTALRQIECGKEVNTREIRWSLRMLCNGVIKAGEFDQKIQ
ncbi:MAG TPA: TetR/AcrR family transcriptional regulator [Bacillales bacterium]|nr:TetR/AcrR family transcriptional regulator [Bacillales bacterium]